MGPPPACGAGSGPCRALVLLVAGAASGPASLSTDEARPANSGLLLDGIPPDRDLAEVDAGAELEREPSSLLRDEPSDPALSELSRAGKELGVCGSELAGLCRELDGEAAAAADDEESRGISPGAVEASLEDGMEVGLPGPGAAVSGGEPSDSAGAMAGTTAPSASAGAAASAAGALGVAPAAIAAARAAAHTARRRRAAIDARGCPRFGGSWCRLLTGASLGTGRLKSRRAYSPRSQLASNAARKAPLRRRPRPAPRRSAYRAARARQW